MRAVCSSGQVALLDSFQSQLYHSMIASPSLLCNPASSPSFFQTREVLFEGTKNNQRLRAAAQALLDSFQAQLQRDRYHGIYFARAVKDRRRLCDDGGWFSCQGAYDEAACGDHHLINPYGTKEHMVLFSTWNLDHV